MKSAAVEIPPKEKTGHGGKRDGAGRKPKALKYASELAEAEGRLMSALPDAVEALITAANSGDVSAAKYLLDRAFGRVAAAEIPPALDTKAPIDEDDLMADIERKTRQDKEMGAFLDSVHF